MARKKAADVEPGDGPVVTFTGDPRGKSNPEKPMYGGIAFPLNEPVRVHPDWLKKWERITRNDHFKVG